MEMPAALFFGEALKILVDSGAIQMSLVDDSVVRFVHS